MKSKRRISIIIILIIAISSVLNVYATSNLLDNIKNSIDKQIANAIDKLIDIKNHWASTTIDTLVSKGIINGYPDGSFKPDNTITVAEFTKIVTVSVGANIGTVTGEWYTPYVDAATSRGIIKAGEFKESDMNRPINRGEMARMVARATVETYPTNILDYSSLIGDYEKLPANLREYILNAYFTGIIGGYPDGTFKADNKATRAEASTMIERMIDTTKRLKVEIIDRKINRVVYQDELGYGYIEGPESQITDEVIKLAKSIKPLRFEAIADKERQNYGYWFGFYHLIEHDINELWYKDWTFNIMCTSHPELNKSEFYNHNTQKYEILERLDSHWYMTTTFVTYFSHNPETRIKAPVDFLHFEEYGTRKYRKQNEFKEGDVITYRVRSRRPLVNDPIREKTDVYFIYEQVIEIELKDLR